MRVVRGISFRSLTVAFGVAVAVALVATPIYVLLATAQFTLRSFWDFGDVVPAARSSGFGRDFLDLELVLALFAVAAAIALYVDRPEREQRSVAELLALPAALAAGVAMLLLPHSPATPARSRRAGSRCRSTRPTSPQPRSGSAA